MAIVGSGLYGYGHDYYATYYKPNLDWGGPRDRAGFIIATLSINGMPIGLYLVSFVLSLSVGYFIRDSIGLILKPRLNRSLFVLFIIVVAIHTWPVIMATSNVMRQGLAMSMMFVALVWFLEKRFFYLCIFSCLAAIFHKSGALFGLLLVCSYLSVNMTSHWEAKLFSFFHIIAGCFLFLFTFVFVPIVIPDYGDSKIIGVDFSFAFAFIGIAFIIIASSSQKFLKTGYNMFVYYFSFCFIAFFALGFKWEFERLGMMTLFCYILSFAILLKAGWVKMYLSLGFLFLLFLTFYTGMYTSLV